MTAQTIDDDASAARRDLAKRLRYVRRMRYLAIFELAERVGVSRSMISALEGGRYSPRLDVIERLARVLRCSPEWLTYGTGEPPLWEPLDEEELGT
jgi:transcriptional regulator with XRE-family HTH domain